MTAARSRGGIGAGDVLFPVAVLALALALAFPWISNVLVRREVEAVAMDVEAIRAAALRHREVKDAWPADGQAGVAPSDLAPFLPADLQMSRDTHRLEWERWEIVEIVEMPTPEGEPSPLAPPPSPDTALASTLVFGSIAGITVHSSDPRMLGLLLERFGTERSFVRDSSWTLVLKDEEGAG